MYYEDHLALGKKEIGSSNFCVLVDAAVMVYDETHSETPTLSQEELDRIFLLFPRKPRSCLVTKNPQNPRSSSSTQKTGPPNPNSRSSLPSSCITKEKKRRATQEIKPSGEAKKAKVAPLSWIGRETPERLVHLMESMEGEDLKLIFEKTLCGTDVNKNQSRLKMPCQGLIRSDFLTPAELGIIQEDIHNYEKTGVGAILVDQRSVKMGVMLKRWETQQSYNYALVCGWNDVVKAYKLKDGDSISLWSFRCRGVLCFALVPPPPPPHEA